MQQPESSHDLAEAAPDLRRLAGRLLVINLLVLAAAYGVYWYWVANAVEGEILAWIQRQRAAGQVFEFEGYGRGGFPLAVRLAFRGVRYAPTADAWSYHTEGLVLTHPITRPETLDIAFTGGQALSFAAGGERFAGGVASATATLRAGGWLPNGEAAVRDLVLSDGTHRRRLAAGELALTAVGDAAAPLAADAPGYVVSVEAARLALPGILPLPFGGEIRHLAITAEVVGALTPQALPALLRQWREEGGAIELTRLSAALGPVVAEGTGTLVLSRDDQPEAAFSFVVEGLPELLDELVALHLLDGAKAAAIKGLVQVRAKTGSDGVSRVRVPLTLQDGELSMGPVPLATVPPIHWPWTRVPAIDG